jgi:hypothetical protein
MPSRFIVSRAARAVGMTSARPSASTSTSVSVAMASISGTMSAAFLLDQRAQRGAVGHVDHVRAMRDLLAGSIGVAIDGDHLDAESLQRDDHFLAELAGAQQHDAQGAGGQGGSDFHGVVAPAMAVRRPCR